MTEPTALKAAQISNIFLLSSQLEVSEAGPVEDTKTTVRVDVGETDINGSSDTCTSATRIMVTASIYGVTEDENPYMDAYVEVVVQTVGGLQEESMEHLRQQHRLVAIEEGYGFVRAHLMNLTSLSPMPQFVLPSIDTSTLA